MIDVDFDQITIPLDFKGLFGRVAPLDVEIGCGKGKFLNELASANPERNVLAIERSAKYHRLCCDRAARRGLRNVRLMRTTGEDLLNRLLPEGSVDTFFVLFPDPWPKKRHHKRRFIQPANIAAIARALVADGRLLVKSDHPAYAEVIAEVLEAADGLRLIDVEHAFAGLPVTGFESKYLVEGRPIFAWALEKTGKGKG